MTQYMILKLIACLYSIINKCVLLGKSTVIVYHVLYQTFIKAIITELPTSRVRTFFTIFVNKNETRNFPYMNTEEAAVIWRRGR